MSTHVNSKGAGRRTSRSRYLLPLVSAVVLALAACGGNSTSAKPGAPIEGGDAIAALYAQAKQEGTVSLYSHVTPTKEIDAFVKAFEKQYPGVKVKLTHKSGSAILETFLSEKRAGVNTADVIQYPGIAPFAHEFQDEGMIDKYTPTSADLYPKEATVPGYAYPWLSYTMGALYNTDMITPEELKLLQTYKGWADPIWKGRISAGSPGSASIQRALFQWVDQDKNLGEQWFRDFAANDPVPFNSVTPAAERVIAGEFVASFPQMSITAARGIRMGAPVGWVNQEYSVTNPALVAVASKAPHPAAAKLMVEFHLSKAGQQAMLEALAADTMRSDLDVRAVTDKNFEPADKLVVVDEDLIAERGTKVVDLWNKLIGPGKD